MPGIVDVPGVEVFGRGRGKFDLPCGFVDEAGVAHRSVVLREMTGEEEDMMDDDEMPVPERTTAVLVACCEKIGTISDPTIIASAIGDTLKVGQPLTSSDRIAMLIYLRRVSVGDIYHFERRCSRCGHMNKNKHLDLRTIDITRVPDERVSKRRLEVTLPRSGRKAVVRVMSAAKESAITDLNLNQRDLRSLAILARLEQLEVDVAPEPEPQVALVEVPPEAVTPVTTARPPRRQTVGATSSSAGRQMVLLGDPRRDLALVKALPKGDRNYLRKVYDAIEVDVDTSILVSCNGRLCGAEFEFPMDLGQAFFSNMGAEPVSAEALNWL